MSLPNSSTATPNGCGCSWCDECPNRKCISYKYSYCSLNQHFGYTMKFLSNSTLDSDGYTSQHQCCRCTEYVVKDNKSKSISTSSNRTIGIYCMCGHTNRYFCWEEHYYNEWMCPDCIESFENQCSIIEIDDKTSRVEDYDKRNGCMRPHDSKKTHEKHRRSRQDTRHYLRDHNRNSKKKSLTNSLRDFHL